MKQANWAFINTLLLIGIYVAGYYVYQRVQNVETQINNTTAPVTNLLSQIGL